MSGDVQPRKRKDKKRKKDENNAEQLSQQFAQSPVTPTPLPNQIEEINLHVHKDGGTGGGICAKIVFFLLFSALAVVIGLIITEHRGQMTTSDVESKFSQIFEGWIDNSHIEHDEQDDVVNSLEEQEEFYKESYETEELNNESNENEDNDASEEQSEEEANLESDQTESEEQVYDDSVEIDNQYQDSKNDQNSEDEEEDLQLDEKYTDIDEEEENQKSEEIDYQIEQAQVSSEEEEEEKEEEEEEEEVEQEVEDEVEEEEEEEDNAKTEKQETYNSKKQLKKGSIEIKNEEEEIFEAESSDATRMIVKIGVGVALLVVAHVVLVRKWKSDTPVSENKSRKEELPDLSRRNTIVVPSTLEENDLDDSTKEELTDEDEENDIQTEERHSKKQERLGKVVYRDLSSVYTRSLTPESEIEESNKPDYEEEYEEDLEEEEEEEEGNEDDDEDEEDEEDEEEEEDRIENQDNKHDKHGLEDSDSAESENEDILKRLDAKYGKFNQKNSTNDQFSSWKRVNVRNNQAEESDSDKQSDTDSYDYHNITNNEDSKIKEKIDEAAKNIKNNAGYAIKLFDLLLKNNPTSSRCLYGKAQALDRLADLQRNNYMLQQAITFYLKTINSPNIMDDLFRIAADRCINRIRFIGNYTQALLVHEKQILRFPLEMKYRNDLTVSLLIINRIEQAKVVIKDTLRQEPNNGFALVHYGFILKTHDNNLNSSIVYLKRGIESREHGVIDGRFYFHLGDAFMRLGRTKDAMQVYEEGVVHKLFLSKFQRSLYNVNRLKAQPWWSKKETSYEQFISTLEQNWKEIRDEALNIIHDQYQVESENLKDKGDWKQYELFSRGKINIQHCQKCPITCKLIEKLSDASDCRRGQAKFSVMQPGTHVWPHCGPTNCRLRLHLGLKVPSNTFIRVANDTRTWINGKVIIFDDSFEHEVWHNGTTFRLILIIDVWHPELTLSEKRELSQI